MTGIGSFWKTTRATGAKTRRTPPDPGSFPAFATVFALVLGCLTPMAWLVPSDTTLYLGLAVGMITFGARRSQVGKGWQLYLALPLGALFVMYVDLRQPLLLHPLPLIYFYLIGLAAAFPLIELDRWLPSLGRLGDRVSTAAFAARWQFLVVLVVLVQLGEVLAGDREVDFLWALSAEMNALHLLVLAHFFCVGMRCLTVSPESRTRTLAIAVATGVIALVLYTLCQAEVLPRWSELAIAVVLTLGMLPLLLLVGVERSALVVVALLSTLFGAGLSGFAARHGLGHDIAMKLGKILIFFTTISLSLRPSLWRSDADSIAHMVNRFQDLSQAWLTRIEVDARTVVFPRAPSQESLTVPFADFFAPTDHRRLMDFLTYVAGRSTGPAGETGAEGQGEAKEAPTLNVALPELGVRTATAAVISRFPGGAWVAFRGQSRDMDLAARLEDCETRLARAMVREERLLSVASHEMRTPVTVLSMLVDELKSGGEWQEVELSFETTLNRLLGILNDLRVTDDTMRGLNVFTLQELSLHLLEAFSASAAAQGITIRLEMSQRSNLLLQGDPARVTIALSKILHNAIVHSHGTEIVLGAFVTLSDGQAATVSWFIQDNGRGIPPAIVDTLFEPFTASGQEGLGTHGAAGLGLYAAHKALSLMGGEIRIEETGDTGTRFGVTHPARVISTDTQEQGGRDMEAAEGVRYTDRRVLLVEDNKLVGELTANRLRRLISTVDWSETGAEALDMFRRTRPDLVLVDHLLPGMTGSELIVQIRQIDAKVPIIGITASTLGNECESLEVAGANLAVEKPLSFSQIELLVDDLMGGAPH
ncbi:hybrid sensor histidine kinase/response regulator [Acidimangrovimonas sediminis]|uniref:hybrid sensor histidine kinase/response regulator n=1 Tax=Acidimangrovimonas sediminis TaxID=2056283 RepID=UPI000C8099EA|nr:response regulator [Acidimangrovimonas sediminis]